MLGCHMATRSGHQLACGLRSRTDSGEVASKSLADRARAPWPSVPLDTWPPAYASPEDVSLVLQDFDELVEANDSTSLLTTGANLGMKKTRAMALWCEARGFRTSIVERRFSADFRVAEDEPRVALCGVDNALAQSCP